MPVLSVIVPSYHASAYLSRCLDSIIGQTLKDLEIIVVSDGSAADFAICRRYAEKDERVKFLKGRETGVGGARNVGLDAASGTYIAFVDADDWIEPNTFEESLSYFSNPDIDMVLFDTVVSNDLGYNSRQGEEYYLSLKYNGVCRVEKDVVLRTNVSVWNKIFKSDIIKEHQIRFPENMQYEDFPFFYQYAVCSRYFYYVMVHSFSADHLLSFLLISHHSLYCFLLGFLCFLSFFHCFHHSFLFLSVFFCMKS